VPVHRSMVDRGQAGRVRAAGLGQAAAACHGRLRGARRGGATRHGERRRGHGRPRPGKASAIRASTGTGSSRGGGCARRSGSTAATQLRRGHARDRERERVNEKGTGRFLTSTRSSGGGPRCRRRCSSEDRRRRRSSVCACAETGVVVPSASESGGRLGVTSP